MVICFLVKREIDGIIEASSATDGNAMTIVTADEEAELIVNGKVIQVVPAWKWLLTTNQH